MDPLLIITGIEAVVAMVFLFCMSKRPVCMGIFAVLVGVGTTYVAYNMWGLGPFDKVIGSQLVGKDVMRAAVFDPNEEQGVLLRHDVPIPDQTPKHALIEIKAAGLNPSNYKMNVGNIPFLRLLRSHVVGYDVAGVVLSVGSDPSCSHLKVGDEIYGLCPSGSFAEYGACHCAGIAKKAKNLSFIQAASLPVAALTSQEAFERANLKKGQSALVIGASGGCGIYGITLAKAIGAKATGICSTRNVDFVKKIGADAVFDYKSEQDMLKLVKQGKQFDVIYDTVTSFDPVDPNYEPSMKPLLKEGGTYIAINGYPRDWMAGLIDRIFGDRSWHKPNYQLFLLSPSPEKVKELADRFDNGELTDVPIDTTFSLNSDADVKKAFEKMKSRRTVGKLVFDVAK